MLDDKDDASTRRSTIVISLLVIIVGYANASLELQSGSLLGLLIEKPIIVSHSHLTLLLLIPLTYFTARIVLKVFGVLLSPHTRIEALERQTAVAKEVETSYRNLQISYDNLRGRIEEFQKNASSSSALCEEISRKFAVPFESSEIRSTLQDLIELRAVYPKLLDLVVVARGKLSQVTDYHSDSSGKNTSQRSYYPELSADDIEVLRKGIAEAQFQVQEIKTWDATTQKALQLNAKISDGISAFYTPLSAKIRETEEAYANLMNSLEHSFVVSTVSAVHQQKKIIKLDTADRLVLPYAIAIVSSMTAFISVCLF